MLVSIGSLNKVKVSAVVSRLSAYDVEVVSCDAPSGVSNQPFSDAETVSGAKNRALKAKAMKQASIGIGLEAGVEMLEGIMYLTNFGVLVDECDHLYYAGGTRIPLPQALVEPLQKGLELGEVIDAYANRQNVRSQEGAIGILTADLCSRGQNFEYIVDLLWGQYLVQTRVDT